MRQGEEAKAGREGREVQVHQVSGCRSMSAREVLSCFPLSMNRHRTTSREWDRVAGRLEAR